MSSLSPYSIIIDCETLGKSPSSIITEIAAVAFDRNTFAVVDTLECFPDILSQLAAGRTWTADTIAFHQKKASLPNRLVGSDITSTLFQFHSFIKKHDPQWVWIQGPDFDRPLIENLFEAEGGSLPWDYWRTADTRTTWNLAFPGIKHDPRPHHALPDCLATLKDLQSCLLKLQCLTAA